MRAWLLVAVLCGGCRLRFDELPDFDLDAGPLPTCTGHDEDGDGFPDACDVCPTERDGTQLDGDGDGVGDVCDPRPTTSGDYIVRFEPHTDEVSALYTTQTGTREWRGDTLRLGSLTDEGSAFFQLPAYPSRIAFAMHVVDSSTLQQWFGGWYNRDPAGANPKIFASAAYTPNAATVVFGLKEQDASSQERWCPDQASGPARFVTGQSYTTVVDTHLVTGGAHRLVVRAPTASWSCNLAVQVPPYNAGFLEAYSVIVDFDYFIAYGIR